MESRSFRLGKGKSGYEMLLVSLTVYEDVCSFMESDDDG